MAVTRTINAEKLKADVVVIGSGGGLAAAVAARESGAGVILLEKDKIFGGWTKQANAFLAVGSPLQIQKNVTVTSDELFKKYMEYHRYYRINPRIVRAYLDKSGDTVKWLMKKGVEIDLLTNVAGLTVIHMPSNMMASVQDALLECAQDLGVTLMPRTAGKKIIRNTRGNITGVLAIRDKTEINIETKCVVIATGGFGANRELLKKYCPDYYDSMKLWTWPPFFKSHSGDGIYMAGEIGASLAEWVPIYHRAGPDFGGYPWKPNIPWALNRGMIWVNKTGKRFADENCVVMYAGNALRAQPDQIAYALFSDDLVEAAEAQGAVMPMDGSRVKQSKLGGGAIMSTPTPVTNLKEKLRGLVNTTGVIIADSWEEIALRIKVDPKVLKAEIDKYDSFCQKGHDDDFAKDPKSLVPLRKPRYYALRIYGDAGETLGGVIVNEQMAVLDKNSEVIPGAFVAGVLADGHQGQTYDHDALAGAAVGFAVVSGQIAGESASRFVKSFKK
jgi:fumarate reductase flavoprotein subunit